MSDTKKLGHVFDLPFCEKCGNQLNPDEMEDCMVGTTDEWRCDDCQAYLYDLDESRFMGESHEEH